jgi:DNA-binding transcriptional regulator YhcF (GntR family)
MKVWPWLKAIRDSALSPSAKLTAFVLATYMRNGTCWPARRRIAAGIGKSERTVTRALQELREAGAIEIEHRMNSSSVYQIAGAVPVLVEHQDAYADVPF